MTTSLVDKIVAIATALHDLPHAFGGALALAYYAEPRATVDIDLNVFIEPPRFTELANRLRPLGVEVDSGNAAQVVQQDGQVRVFWDATAVDLFLAYDRFHDAAASARRTVPFADTEISVLAPEHLIVCKTIFDRPRDWVDIDAMLELGPAPDVAEVLRWVGRIAGDDDPRYERIATVLTHRDR